MDKLIISFTQLWHHPMTKKVLSGMAVVFAMILGYYRVMQRPRQQRAPQPPLTRQQSSPARLQQTQQASFFGCPAEKYMQLNKPVLTVVLCAEKVRKKTLGKK